MRTSFNYFIVYCYKNNNKFGFGTTKVILDVEIDSMEIIGDIESEIEDIENLDKVTVLNWKLLK